MELVAGSGAVEELLGADHERLGVAPGGEEAAGLLVPEQVEQLVPPPAGPARATAPCRSTRTVGRRPRPARRGPPPRPGAGPGRPASCASAARRRTWTPRGTRRSPRPGGRSRSEPVAAATSASVADRHGVPLGQDLLVAGRLDRGPARAAARRARASSISGGRARGAPTGRTGMERPSQLPGVGDPVPLGRGPTRCPGRVRRSSSRVKVAWLPSTPPASASKEE